MPKSVTPKDLRRVFYLTSDYLDFFSVVDGFRDIAVVKLTTYPVTMVSSPPTMAVHTLPLQQQKTLVRTFLSQHRSNYELLSLKGITRWHFILKKTEAKRVRAFVKTHTSFDQQYHKDLGLLLSYPPCCTKYFLRTGARRGKKEFKAIPFVPCSKRCATPWTVAYERLMKKYDVKKAEFNIQI